MNRGNGGGPRPLPFTTPGPSLFSIVISPNGNFLYQLNQDGSISGFSIDATSGNLTAISGSPFAIGAKSVNLVIDPAREFLHAANVRSIIGYKIDANTGALTTFNGPSFPASDPKLMTVVKIQ